MHFIPDQNVKLYDVGITFLLGAILLSVGWKRELGLTQSLPLVCPYAMYTSDVPIPQHDERLSILQYTVTFILQDIAKLKIINARQYILIKAGYLQIAKSARLVSPPPPLLSWPLGSQPKIMTYNQTSDLGLLCQDDPLF